ncbi:MAG: HD domain-containing protein [Oscillospiraceae bacterium]|nr:HD domain-containing protein [Oscillospiraceae bacterium]
MEIDIPVYVRDVLNILEKNRHDAYVAGGCVRDSLLGKEPGDWDVATDCVPEKMMEIFPNAVPTGIKYGTVTVLTGGGPVEVTAFRTDSGYSDGRRPGSVKFTKNLCKDLERRDFTINSIAYNLKSGLIDPLGGVCDLKNRIIRCSGDPSVRFAEDYLRILRAFRFSAKLGFLIEPETKKAAVQNKWRLLKISAERVQKEFNEILLRSGYKELDDFLSEFSEVLLPELYACKGITQRNNNHRYDVFDHIVRGTADYTGNDIKVKLAILLHDVGKSKCKTTDEMGLEHFYGHGEISEQLAKNILIRMKYPGDVVRDVCRLIKHHHILIEPNEGFAKKMLREFGREQAFRLMELKIADTGNLKESRKCWTEEIMECRKLMFSIIEKKQPCSLADLAVNGTDIIKHLNLVPSERVGEILEYLLDRVIDDPKLNEKKTLLEIAAEIPTV